MIDESSYEFQERIAIKIDSGISEQDAIRQTREEYRHAAQKNAIKAAKTNPQRKLAYGKDS